MGTPVRTSGQQQQSGAVTNDHVSATAGIVESKLALNFATHSNANDPTAGEKAALVGEGTPSSANKYGTRTFVENSLIAQGWERSVLVLTLLDDSLAAAPASPTTGDAYIVATGGLGVWAGLDGHLVEWHDTSWVDILGVALPPGSRCLVGAGAAGSFAGKDRQIVSIETAWAPGFTYAYLVPLDGWVALVSGNGSVWENQQFIYSTSDALWNLLVVEPSLGLILALAQGSYTL